ncbi:MAG: hypothetical protein EU529_05080 [Promethearchaeota archaeon]|nr:MAG: hypothetical protein EU529_05080 [Candidatus Lokiarchaeota archaeon]
MPSIIKQFWLFSKDGLPIAEFSGDEQTLDKTLMGGIVSAIKTFSQQLTSKGLQSLMLENDKLSFGKSHDGNAILVFRTSSKIKDKKIQKVSKNIVEIFEELYDVNDILSWDGDVRYFNGFKEKLQKFLK